MKCDSCGKEEVNFHYTSNINGNITERHLCGECAEKLRLTGKLGFNGLFGPNDKPGQTGRPNQPDKTGPDASFEDIFTELFGARPSRRMFGGFGVMFPTIIIPAVFVPGAGVEGGAAQPENKAGITIGVDEDMKKRRELNVLREQMRQAAEAEDFEKAAALRDAVRALEAGGC